MREGFEHRLETIRASREEPGGTSPLDPSDGRRERERERKKEKHAQEEVDRAESIMWCPFVPTTDRRETDVQGGSEEEEEEEEGRESPRASQSPPLSLINNSGRRRETRRTGEDFSLIHLSFSLTLPFFMDRARQVGRNGRNNRERVLGIYFIHSPGAHYWPKRTSPPPPSPNVVQSLSSGNSFRPSCVDVKVACMLAYHHSTEVFGGEKP